MDSINNSKSQSFKPNNFLLTLNKHSSELFSSIPQTPNYTKKNCNTNINKRFHRKECKVKY